MVAYLLTQALRQCWRDIDLTVQEALDRLASLRRPNLDGQSCQETGFAQFS